MTKICPYQVYAHRLVLPSGGPKDDPENDRRRPQGLEVHDQFDAILDPKKIKICIFKNRSRENMLNKLKN